MRIGFITNYSSERVSFAKMAGFDVLEIAIGKGFSIDQNIVKDDELKRTREELDKFGIATASVIYCDDLTIMDFENQETLKKNFSRVLDICKALGSEILTCNAWVNGKSIKKKVSSFRNTYSILVKLAEDKNIVIGLENCPHGLNNLAYSPATWEIIFTEIPSHNLGLEFDPSHLVWQRIDYIKALYKFGNKIFAFHAKDTEIIEENLIHQGIYGDNWWRYRIPGYGIVDWKRIFLGLADIGYKGDMCIEHEDPVFGGDRTDEGLKRGLVYLRQIASIYQA